MKFLTRLIQLILLLIPLGLFFWLVQREIVPSGVFVVRHAVGETSPYMDALAPKDRVKDEGTIIGDPVYFFLHPHRFFDRLEFEVWFQNLTVPIIEFGGLAKTNPEVYDLHPLQNRLIDELTWDKISDGTFTLYQREPVWNSVADFLAQEVADMATVAVYKADYPVPFRLDQAGYQPTTDSKTLEVSLRGSHQLKTYIRDETLRMEFEYIDMNRDEGTDAVTATVFDEAGNPVADARSADDGNTKSDAISSSMKRLTLDVPNLPQGVYKIVLNTTRDVFVRKIHTPQQKLIFLNSIFIGDEIGYRESPSSIQFNTTSLRLRMQTRHAEGVQEVAIGGVTHSITEPYKMYAFETTADLKTVEIPQGDLEIFFDGPVAFTPEQLFYPDPQVIRPYTNLQDSEIQYVLTTYIPPRREGEWLVQTVKFNTAALWFDKKTWKFAFSAPEIESLHAEFTVKAINTRFIREPFQWRDLLDLIRS